MKVRFDEIPAEGLTLQISDSSWFPDEALTRTAPVKAWVALRKKGERVLLEGSLATVLEMVCDRCLEPFVYEIDTSFSLIFEIDNEISMAAVGEHECSAAEMDLVYLAAPVIDLNQILHQQLALMLPIKKLCSHDCRGLCHNCGANLNKADCECHNQQKNRPLAGLGRLLTKE